MTVQDWRLLADHLADELTERGVLTESAWRAALTSVPRHQLVPRFYTQNSDATWKTTTATDDGYLSAVYSNKPLVTALANRQPCSSSSQPSLMIRMLEALKIAEGERVLEIGTGTGYNAGLMSHRIGEDNVYSVDIDAELVDTARERLDALGWHPSLATIDGAEGWPAHGPYDKVIATCSVPSVPWAWIEQTKIGGLILVDVKAGVGAGNLVLLERRENHAEGRYLNGWAGFMGMRHLSEPTPAAAELLSPANAVTGTTTADPQPWHSPIVWHLAVHELPAGVSYGYLLDEASRRPRASRITAPDGSWCAVDLECTDGRHAVREAGPTRLWESVERAHATWAGWGQPGWDQFGLTVTPAGHTVWVRDPGAVIADLPAAA